MNYDKDLIVCVSGVSNSADIASVKDVGETATKCFCSTQSQLVTKALVDEIHNNGMFSKPFTVNNISDIETLFSYGCDMIITDSVKPSDLN